jgi:peptidoglycan hydrolase-like protein with peptidoglycan-binding domain
MKMRPLLFVLAFTFTTGSLWADELIRSVQESLKEQGFYYGEVSGVGGPETTAAVKRYQIRNGLEVTGTLTKETLDALGAGGSESATEPSPAPPAPKPKTEPAQPVEPLRPPAPKPPTDLRKDRSVQESDRSFLKPKPRPRPPEPPELDEAPPRLPNPSIEPSGGSEYGRFFSKTPYASAPREVQESTVRQAQKFLRELGFYHEAIDGDPGPALEEAVLGYQRFIRLPLTGRLDLETLSAMRLLPGRGGSPARPVTGGSTRRPLRGIWID